MTNSQRKPPTGARENQVPASTALPIRHGASGGPAAGATAAGFGTLRQHSAARRIMRRRTRFLFIVTAAVLGVVLITGCGPAASGTSGVQQLIQQFPWLSALGISFLQGLLEQFGTNLLGLLAAAAAAL
jgi:hypothetical protein